VRYDKAVTTNCSATLARAEAVYSSAKPTQAALQTLSGDTVNCASTATACLCQPYLISLGAKAVAGVTLSPSPNPGVTNTPVTVTVSYNYSGLGLGALLNTFTGVFNLSSTTVMNNE